MSLNYVFINDKFVESKHASLLVTDLAIQRGYGIFDFFKTINNKPIFLNDHLARFFSSAQKMHLEINQTRAELTDILQQLIEKNNLPDSGIRMTLTGGYSADGYGQAKPNLVITQYPLTVSMVPAPAGINLITYPHQRQLSAVKTLDYLMAVWLQPLIKEQSADDVLYHHEGLIKECPRANFFMVTQDNKILTPVTNVLKGIIRKNVLELKHSSLQIIEKDFSLADLEAAKEAFITSTTKHILPVVKINGKVLGDGKPGTITQQLAKQLLTKVIAQC